MVRDGVVEMMLMKIKNLISELVLVSGVVLFGAFSTKNLEAQDVSPRPNQPAFIQQWQSIRNQLRESAKPFQKPEYGIRFLVRGKDSDNVEQLAIDKLPQRIILVIGGLQGDQDSAEQFAKSLQQCLNYPSNTRLAIFDYLNDGSIPESGGVLRDLLRELHRESPDTKVSIVAHSMGGLVTRWALESPVEPKKTSITGVVDHLTMICPPNRGSALAQYADVLEISDALIKMKKGTQSFITILTSLIHDGLGEACVELIPDSEFLRKLNAFERAKGVRYTILTGTRGPISPLIGLASSMAINETRARTRVQDNAEADKVLDRLKELMTSDELTLGLGDGAVAIESARLAGVSEFITVPIQHAEWASVDLPQTQELIKKVAANMTGA